MAGGKCEMAAKKKVEAVVNETKVDKGCLGGNLSRGTKELEGFLCRL